jgi:hypothetical protein
MSAQVNTYTDKGQEKATPKHVLTTDVRECTACGESAGFEESFLKTGFCLVS